MKDEIPEGDPHHGDREAQEGQEAQEQARERWGGHGTRHRGGASRDGSAADVGQRIQQSAEAAPGGTRQTPGVGEGDRRQGCIVFEGRDAAGKGGTIKRIRDRVSPRVFPIVALPAPTEREKSQMYIQRYVPHLPAAGEVVIFDRSWYNRAGVEPVMGFCTDEQSQRFLQMAPGVEQAIGDSGVVLLKYWLEVGEAEQTKRLQSRVDDPRKIWKLSG